MATVAKNPDDADRLPDGKVQRVYERGLPILVSDPVTLKAHRASPSIMAHVGPVALTLRPGTGWLSVAEAAGSLWINEYDGTGGYQRDLSVAHARSIARALLAGKEMPPIEVSITETGRQEVHAGQHRVFGHLIAGLPVEYNAAIRSGVRAARLFAAARHARPIDPSLLVMTGEDPLDRYIQDAVANIDHPWFPLVGADRKHPLKMAPNTAKAMLIAWACDSLDHNINPATLARWSHTAADDLSPRLTPLGTKESNPGLYRPTMLKALSVAALLILRRNGNRRTDTTRWDTTMSRFPFDSYRSLTSEAGAIDVLLGHWNKRLSHERRTMRP